MELASCQLVQVALCAQLAEFVPSAWQPSEYKTAKSHHAVAIRDERCGVKLCLAANPDGQVIIGHVEERVEKLLDGTSGTTITAG